jgi:hypothetical protein
MIQGSAPRFPINGGIQRGIVVHFELTVEFEAAFTPDNLRPEPVEAFSQIGALFFEEVKTLFVSANMTRRRVAAQGFFVCVKDFQREDGKPVEDQSGRLGVQWSFGRGQPMRLKGFKQKDIAPLHEIVSALVHAVDASLNLRDLGVGCLGRASLVFEMPQLKIGLMLGADGTSEIIGRLVGRGLTMPLAGEFVEKSRDGVRVKQRFGGCGHANSSIHSSIH